MSNSFSDARTVFTQPGSTTFDGAQSSAIVVADNDRLDIPEVTIAFSFTADSVGGYQGLLSRDASGYSGDGNHLSIYIEKGVLKVRMQDGDDEIVLSNDLFLDFVGVSTNQEYHVAVTFGDGTGALYVNGELADSGQTGLTWATSPEPLQIGALGWSSSSGAADYKHVFDGEIRDLAIYDGIATAEDVKTLAGDTTPSAEPETGPVTEPEPETDPDTGSEAAPGDTSDTGDTPEAPSASEALYTLSGENSFSTRENVLNLPGDDFLQIQETTIAFAFTANDIGARQGLLSRDASGYSGDGNHLSIYIEQGVLKVRMQDGDKDLMLTAKGLEAGTEYHLGVTFGDGEGKLLIDGEVVDSGATGLTWATSPEYIQIGALGWGSKTGTGGYKHMFDGTIRDLAVYDAILDEADIAALAGEVPSQTPAPEPVQDQIDPTPQDPAPTTGQEPEPETQPQDDNTETGGTGDGSDGQANTSGTNIYLVDATTDAIIANLSAGDTIDPALIGAANLTLVVDPGADLGAKSVTFDFDNGTFTKTENFAPYALFGDNRGDFNSSGTLFSEAGNYSLNVKIFGENGGNGTLLESTSLTFSVGTADDGAATAPLTGADITAEPVDEGGDTGDAVHETGGDTGDASTDSTGGTTGTGGTGDTANETGGSSGGGSTGGGAGLNTEYTGSEEPEHGIVTPLTNGVDVVAGRVTTLEHQGGEVESIRVTDLPQFGNLTVNSDNTLALVLSQTQQTGNISFEYEVTYTNGTTETVQKTVDVVPGTQDLGWAPGDYYMLEEAADGSIIVEHGDVHREVYISESNDALSAADIAQMEGISASQVTASWLANNPQYGSDPSMALQPDIGMKLWEELTEGKNTSHWLLFEAGYEYSSSDLGSIVQHQSSGESELHPLYIGSYGEGARPVLNSEFKIFASNGPYENIVFQGVNLADGARVFTGHNIMFDDVRFEEMLNAQNIESLTVHDSVFFDITKDAASNGSTWGGMPDRMQGMYVDDTNGLLLDGLFLDQIGWEDDYRFDKSADGGQVPSIYSHNIYIQYDSTDITMRDSISMRAASFGAQIRPGGLIEDNVFIDNNAALNTLGGDSKLGTQEPIGNYSLLNGNLVTSGAHKTSEDFFGGLTIGIVNEGRDTALVDNIVTHLADPNNPQEQAFKTEDQNPLNHKQDPYYDDTIIYKWIGGVQDDADQNAGTNIGGLDPDLLDQTTIQLFAADLLGDPNATIADLGEYLRGISEGTIDAELTADDILAYFQASFGIYEGERTDPITVRFTPDDRSDGFRWDNKLNWNTGDRPMDGDSVDLASNWVSYAGTHKINDLFMGDNGRLEVDRGRLDVQGELHGGQNAQIDIMGSGQLWVEDYRDDDRLDVDVDGGRFANTGFFDGLLDMHVTDGQALLGVDDAVMELGQGSVITVDGDAAKVGFDGEAGGVSVLRMETGSELRMVADGSGFSTIEEFRSGAHENDIPDVLSAFDMGEGTLLIDIGAIAGGGAREEVLVDTDQIIGMFDDVEFIGLGANQDATLTVDYETDKVTVTLGAAGQGSGQINVATVGNMLDAAEDGEIWDALTEGQGIYEEADPTPTVNGEDLEEEDILAA